MTSTYRQRIGLASLACAALLAGCAPLATQSIATPSSIDAHVERAQQAAGHDLRNLLRLCEPQPRERATTTAARDENLRKLIARPAPPPTQVFENFYFVGGDFVSAWVLKTSAGLVLFDALNNAAEARELIEGGLTKLGLDPREIKYIVVTHGHGDHYGGAQYLVEKFHPHVVATDADWNMMHGKLEFDSSVWGRAPARDMSVRDGETLTVGDATITFLVTSGHTLGTLSPMFDVRAGGRVYHAVLWGGTAFNFGKDFSRFASYVDNTERLRALAATMPIDVLVSNHSEWDDSIAKMNALRAAGPGTWNPFLTGSKVVQRSMQVMGECARAQAGRFGY
jgi:metallo-beta-lactamase class B